jgi:hypothetical protein
MEQGRLHAQCNRTPRSDGDLDVEEKSDFGVVDFIHFGRTSLSGRKGQFV